MQALAIDQRNLKPDSRAAKWPAILFVTAANVWTLAMVVSLKWRFFGRGNIGTDFFNIPRGYNNLLMGNSIFCTDIGTYGPYATPWLIHPFPAVVIGPWTAPFAPWTAFWLFEGFSLGLLLVSAWLLAAPFQTPTYRGFAYFAIFCSIPTYEMLWIGQHHALVVVAVALILSSLMRLAEEPQLEKRYLRWIQLGLVISLLSKPMVVLMLPVLFLLPETRRKLLLPLGVYAAVSLLFLLVGRLNAGGYNGLHWLNMLTASSSPQQFLNGVIPVEIDCREQQGLYSLPAFVDRIFGHPVPSLFYKLPLLAVAVMSFSPLMLDERGQRLQAVLVTASLCILSHFLCYYTAWEYQYTSLLPLLPVLLWLWQRESVSWLRRLLLTCFVVSLLVSVPTPSFLAPQEPYCFRTVSFLQRVGAVLIVFTSLTVYGVASTWSRRRRPTVITREIVGQIWPALRLAAVLGALLGSVWGAVYLTVPTRSLTTPTKWTKRDFDEHYEEAITQLQRAVKADPACAGVYSNLGLAFVGQGRLAEAIPQFRRALEIEPDNFEAHSGLGEILASQGRPTEAIVQFQQALKTRPDDANVRNDLGNALASSGRPAEAIGQFQRALTIVPNNAVIRNNLGIALASSGRPAEAIVQFQRASAMAPDDTDIRINLGRVLDDSGQPAEAMAQFRRVLEIRPDCAEAHVKLGNALLARNRFAEAAPHFRKALEIQPDSEEFQKNWAWLLATCPAASLRNGAEAIEHAERANRLCGGERPDILDVLAAAYAEAGWFPEAVATARKALGLAVQQKASVLADGLRARLALYEAGRPFHQGELASGLVPPKH